jgi:hypothetical protein
MQDLYASFSVYIFLGFCALIVVAQLLPAIMTLVGMVKGAVTHQTEVTTK